MQLQWKKLLSREGIDITTIAEVDKTFCKYAASFMNSNEELHFTIFENRKLSHISACDYTKYAQKLLNKYFSSANQIKKYEKLGGKIIKRSKQKVKSVTLEKGISEFRKEFKLINEHFSIMPWIALELWQEQYDQIIQKAIKKNNLESEQEEIIYVLSKPWKKTALMKLQEEIGKIDNNILIKKYQFLREWSIIWYRQIDEEWILKIPPLKKEKKVTITFSKAIQLLNLTTKDKNIIKLAPYLIFFKDYRDDIRRMHTYTWHSYFEKIAKHLNTDINDLGYFTLDEIERFTKKKKINEDLLLIRKTNSICITYDVKNKLIKCSSSDSTNYKKYSIILQKVTNQTNITSEQKIVKGISATKGITTGKAFIIRTYHDCKRITESDILIANSTHPNYLSAMQKAKAFVTNEGGMICHAAIVAREMKKPCIVGTKTATQIFKEGDLIEVNADKGIVRKI